MGLHDHIQKGMPHRFEMFAGSCMYSRKKKILAYKTVGVDGAVLEFEVCMHRPVYILILLMLRSCRQTLLNRCLMVGG